MPRPYRRLTRPLPPAAVRYKPTPAILATMTHYELGSERAQYSTSSQHATLPPPPHEQRVGARAAGQQPSIGPSEVEQRFMKNINSRDYNIINGGPRLLGRNNTDARLASAADAAFAKPIGRKQHPNVDPRDRGVTGMRQSFDIITGLDRPKERW